MDCCRTVDTAQSESLLLDQAANTVLRDRQLRVANVPTRLAATNVDNKAILSDDLRMNDNNDPVAVFRDRLYSEWLPTFCNDAARGYGTGGFREASIRVGALDAANFLRAMDGGLVKDIGGGRYRCAQSKALEQLFWEREKNTTPRPVTLWMEPVISIATLARFHYDLGWPEERLGMQTTDWAFDLAAYSSAETQQLLVACEVKKSRPEVDHLIADLHHHSRDQPESLMSRKQRHINSFKKWAALRRDRPPFLWVVGPERYEYAFELTHSQVTTTMIPVEVEHMRFKLHVLGEKGAR